MSAESKKSQRKRPSRNQVSKVRQLRNLSAQRLHEEIEVLRSSVAKLTHSVEMNARVFSDAFQMVDAQNHVMQRALNDFAKDAYENSRTKMGIHPVPSCYTTADHGIDFAEYMAQYFGAMGFADFVACMKEAFPQERLILTPAEAEGATIVFGGS